MRFFSAVGVGVLTAIATAVLWIIGSFVLPIVVPMFLSRIGTTQSGSGVGAAFIESGSILLAAVLGFVGGVTWMLWRR